LPSRTLGCNCPSNSRMQWSDILLSAKF
jgi:hypothetical protein